MLEPHLYNLILVLFALLAVAVFILLFFVPAPYGRHVRKGWGPLIPSRWGWFFMELPASLVFFFLFIRSERNTALVPVILFLVWQTHYVHRAFLYPFSLRKSRKMPLTVAALAFVFNIINATLQAGWIFHLAPASRYTTDWLTDPRFILGLCVFYTGYLITKSADRTLRSLRQSRDSEYTIPQGGLFRIISCPNYFGEIIEWSGWAMALWSGAGVVFMLWTMANLIPRARAHHLWYQREFVDYPRRRKAIIPFIF